MSDFLHGFRLLRKQPGFAVTAILALAIGIGSNTAIFTFVDALLLRPLPVPEADRVVMIYERLLGLDRNDVSPANWLDWQSQSDSFEALAAWARTTAILTQAGEPEVLESQMVSHEFFELLRVRPFRGRLIRPDDDRPKAAPVVVLSYSLWQRRFGGDEAIVGRSIRLNERRCEVIGIMPPGFTAGISNIDFWQPYTLDRTRNWRADAGRFMFVIGRLKPGVSVAQAQTQMSAIAKRLEQAYPAFNKNSGVNVMPLRDSMTIQVKSSLLMLLIAVGALLLIGCLNVANLLLARAASRQSEFAVRAALGAGRSTIVKQLLTENLMLALAGGALGVVLAHWMVAGLLALIPKGLVQVSDVPLDWRVLSFAVAISFAASMLSGLTPALNAARGAVAGHLHDGSRSVTRRAAGLRQAFIVGQVALTVVLLCVAGLLLRTFSKLQSVDLGLDPYNVATLRVGLPGARYNPEQRVRFFSQVLQRISALPGVEQASAASVLPVVGLSAGTGVQIQGKPVLPMSEARIAGIRSVMPRYFRTFRIPILQGRDFTDDEMRQGTPPVFIVNRAFVRAYLPNEDPLATSISVIMQNENPYGRIIGVIGDVRESGIEGEPQPMVYYAYGRLTYPGMSIIVRTSDPAGVSREAVRIVRELDANQPVTRIQRMEVALAEIIARQRMNAIVTAAFAGSALLLACIGIYGVLAYFVSERRREIGVRIALGAPTWQVNRLIAVQGLAPASIGLVTGLGGALLLSRFMRSLLYQVQPMDPVTIGGVVLLLTSVSVAAMLIPARRATRIDPAVALRQE